MMSGEMRETKIIATFVDKYGDEQKIHRVKGRRLSVKREGNTVALALNRVVCEIVGKNIRRYRLERKMTAKQLCLRAGLASVSPKERIFEIENAGRQTGIRFGTLYAIALALGVEVHDLLPSVNQVRGQVSFREETALDVA